MATYEIEIIETLSRVVEVEAANEDEAFEIVDDMYHNEEVVLDADDYCGTKFAYLKDGVIMTEYEY